MSSLSVKLLMNPARQSSQGAMRDSGSCFPNNTDCLFSHYLVLTLALTVWRRLLVKLPLPGMKRPWRPAVCLLLCASLTLTVGRWAGSVECPCWISGPSPSLLTFCVLETPGRRHQACGCFGYVVAVWWLAPGKTPAGLFEIANIHGGGGADLPTTGI